MGDIFQPGGARKLLGIIFDVGVLVFFLLFPSKLSGPSDSAAPSLSLPRAGTAIAISERAADAIEGMDMRLTKVIPIRKGAQRVPELFAFVRKSVAN
jgi:hypothetical protein